MTRQKPIEVTPQQGGRLASVLSGETVGIFNYEVKRDFHRKFDREVRSEGDVEFCPRPFTVDDIPSVVHPPTTDPITLLVMLRHPNGRTVVIAGTATTIWKCSAVDNPLYYDLGYIDTGYYDETAVAWREIGSGFSESGRRWEVDALNGYLILNNAVDLTQTFRLPDDRLTPMYELRELGVASVGTIKVVNTSLMCGDIRQIKEDKLVEIMSPLTYAGASQSGRVKLAALATINSGTAGVAGNIVTASNGTFYDGSGFTNMAGLSIKMANGVERSIASVNSATEAVLSGDVVLVEPSTEFFLSSTGSDFWISGITLNDFITLGIDNPIGLKIWWTTGESRVVTGLSGNIIVVDGVNPIPYGPILIENPLAYARFTDDAFLDRIQWRTMWSFPDQPRRWGAAYPGTISPADNTLTLDYPVKSMGFSGGDILLTGMASGNLPATVVYFDGLRGLISGRAITDFYSTVLATLEGARTAEEFANAAVASAEATEQYAEKTLAAAKEAAAADEEDADLAAAVSAASAALDLAKSTLTQLETLATQATEARVTAEAASLAEESVEAQLADTVSTISRIYDLQHDGSAILRIGTIRSIGVVFTETAIFLSRYQTNGSFAFSLIEIPRSHALFYRNTLVQVDSSYLLYASATSFMRFDLTDQTPTDFITLKSCRNIFFDQATPGNMERIFAMDNGVSKEIYFCFPSATADKALRYNYEFDSASTTSAEYTAGANATFPGGAANVFLLGKSTGQVFRYGLIAGPDIPLATVSRVVGNDYVTVALVSGESLTYEDIGKTIRLSNGNRYAIALVLDIDKAVVVGLADNVAIAAQPAMLEPACWIRSGAGYQSSLQSGAEDFNSTTSEKKCSRYSIMLSKFSPNQPLSVTIRSGRNANEVTDRIGVIITPPEGMQPIIISDYFLGDRIEIDGMNNPLEIANRVFHVSGIPTGSFGRRPT
jgi:hypothetical protein